MRECSFLRCTSIELAYNLPREFLQRLRMQTVKFYARVNNPFLDHELQGMGRGVGGQWF